MIKLSLMLINIDQFEFYIHICYLNIIPNRLNKKKILLNIIF